MVARSDIDIAEDLDENGRSLTPWESSFLDSILKQLDKVGRLTRKQSDTLWKIYKERMPDA